MGTYKDTLQLIDKVSQPLSKISAKAEQNAKATEKAMRANERLQRTYKGLGGALRRFDKQLSVSYAHLERVAKRTENIKKLGGDIQSVGNKMTVGLTLPITALAGASVKAAADMEAMQQQLSTMLQSEQKGAEMFDDIKKMAAKTPFGTKDLMSATNTMLGFGIAQEKVLPLMRQLGDISGGNKDRFQSLALAFSQVSAAGKLQGQDLLQMINAGFNPLEAISKRTGKSIGQLKEEMSKGKITIDMVEQAMKDATSEGGRFFNMMEKQSKTALGQWSTMQDNLNQALADFGVQIMPVAIKGLEAFSKLLGWFSKLSPGVKKMIIALGFFVAALGPAVSIVGTLITVLSGLPVVIAAVNTALVFLAANPIVLIVGAIVGLIAVIVLLIKNWDKVKKVAVNVGHAIASAWNSLVEKFKGWINKLVGWLDTLLEKLGLLAYFIPGLNAIKIGRDVAGAVASHVNNSRVSQTQNNTTNNTYTTNNYGGFNYRSNTANNLLTGAGYSY